MAPVSVSDAGFCQTMNENMCMYVCAVFRSSMMEFGFPELTLEGLSYPSNI
jgi:hypothetical protein